MKSYLPLFLLLLISPFIYSQTNFYSTDTSNIIGIRLHYDSDKMNAKYCQKVINDSTIIRFTPYEIEKYGFKDGRKYFSREIETGDSIGKVFLERLIDGQTCLYFYTDNSGKYFFIENDNLPLQKIPEKKKYFKTFLIDYSKNYPYFIKISNHVHYNKASLSCFFKRFNSLDNSKSFPHFKYGIHLSQQYKILDKPEKFIEYSILNGQIFNSYSSSFTTGIFMDIPLCMSSVSFHPELQYSKYFFSYEKTFDNQYITAKDLSVTIKSYDLPILIRGALPFKIISPFIDFGIVTSYLSTKGGILTALVSKYHFSYLFGGGIEFFSNSKFSAYLEFRYSNSIKFLYFNSDYFYINSKQFVIGFNL